eukprot:gb/GECG01000879.1/.p1 GENE.gb/GECG01000879.1/~~gb/GECG01000879.1/.p1  ORF type:complete len:584 (+),score=67.29 gb/GECG01000879.1/:1-1752(+)
MTHTARLCLTKHRKDISGSGSLNIFIDIGVAVYAMLAFAYIYWKMNRDRPERGQWNAKPDFGIGAGKPVQYLSELGMAFSLPKIVVFYLSYHVDSKEVACQVQAQMLFGFPFWGLFMCYMIMLILIFNSMRSRTRHTLIQALPEVKDQKHVLVFPALRGMYSDAVMRQMANEALKNASHPTHQEPAGTVTAVDCWATKILPEQADWIIENAARSRHDWLSSNNLTSDVGDRCWPVLNIKQTSFTSLPLRSDSVDAVIWPFSDKLHVFNQRSMKAKERKRKQLQLFHEIGRVLKPAGVLYTVDLVTAKRNTASSIKKSGYFSEPEDLPGLHFLTFVPSKITKWTLQKNVGDHEFYMEDESSDFQVTLKDEEDYANSDMKELPQVHQETFFLKDRVMGMGILVAIYIGIVAVAVTSYKHLMYPKQVSWENVVGNQFVVMMQYLPLTAVFMVEELNTFCCTHSATGEKTERIVSRQEYWLFYLKSLRNVTIVYLVFNVWEWIPALILDWALHDNVGEHTLSGITTATQIFLFVVVVKSVVFWYRKRRERQEKEAEQSTNFELEHINGASEDTMKEPLIAGENSVNH